MKKYLLLSILILFSVVMANASITRSFYDSSDLQRWNFSFNLGHSFGFNLDSTAFGMESEFTMSLESIFADDTKERFVSYHQVNDTNLVGVIQIKDFNLSFAIDETVVYSDTTDYILPKVSWGKISGLVYFGPLYILLTASDHDRYFDMSGLDNEDLGFSNINYSVIPLTTTIHYKEQRETEQTKAIFSLDNKFSNGDSGIIEEQEYGAIQLGYQYEDLFELKIGFSTQYSFSKFETKKSLMPFAISSVFHFTPLESLSFKLFNIVLSGINDRTILEIDNPLIVGAALGYTFNVGPDLFFTTSAGASFGISWDKTMDPDFLVNENRIKSSDNPNIFSLPMEITVSGVLDWRYLGLFKKEDDYLSFNTSVSDVVTDGVGVAVSFGYSQHSVFRALNVPYLGLKMTLWEYEYNALNSSFDKVQPRSASLVRNFAATFVGNVNYSFGNTYNGFHNYVEGFSGVSNSTITLAPRLDYGFVLDTSYKLYFLKHKLGIIVKEFNVLRGTDKYEVEGGSEGIAFNEEHERIFNNRFDVRLKFGFDILDIFPNFTVQIDWVSGNLVKDGERVLTTYTDYDFFKTNDTNNNVSFDTNAVLGFISFGFVYHFGN